MKHSRCRVAPAVAAGMVPYLAFAQGSVPGAGDYPAKPVRVVVAQGAGGNADSQARLFATKLSESLGRQFIVDNRPGRHISWTLVAKAPPDAVLAGGQSHAAGKVSERADRHCKCESRQAEFWRRHFGLERPPHGDVPVYPGRHQGFVRSLQRGGAGSGGSPGGPDRRGVHDRERGVARQVRQAARIGDQRRAALPAAAGYSDYRRAGVGGFDASAFHGWAAPAGTPAATVGKLSAEIVRIAKSPEIASALGNDNSEPVGSTPDQFKRFIAAEIPRWRKLVQDSGITVD